MGGLSFKQSIRLAKADLIQTYHDIKKSGFKGYLKKILAEEAFHREIKKKNLFMFGKF